MKKERRIPTLIALFLLVVSVTAGVFLIKSGSKFFVGARPEITPKQIKITNIGEDSFTVSWITDEQTSGFVQYGTGEELPFTALDDRDQLSGQQSEFRTHHVTLRGLTPATNYFFRINSGGKTFGDNGQPYQVKTGSAIRETMPLNDIAYGTVVKQDGSPAQGVIVYLSLANAAPLSTLTKASGSWAIPLNLARSADLSSWAAYDKEASIEEILVQGGSEGTATAVAVTKYDSPLPTIVLGQNFDFRQAPLLPTPTPTGESLISKFSAEGLPISTPALQIINPLEGEKISTSTPEIFGTGPAGETLTITIESPEVLQGEIIIGGDGSWRWTPPTGLSPGQHTITVSLANGQRVSHSFIVLAAGTDDSPSFTASPSATTTPFLTMTPTPTSISTPTPTITSIPTPTVFFTPTPTATFTPTPTVSGRVSIPSTESSVPKSGDLTPTFLFSIMGMILIFLGLLSNILLRKI